MCMQCAFIKLEQIVSSRTCDLLPLPKSRPQPEFHCLGVSLAEGATPNGGLTAPVAQSDPPAQTNTAASNDAVPSAEAAKSSEGAGPATDSEMTDAPGEAAVPSGEAAANSAASREPAAQEPDVKIDPVTIGFRTFASGKECYDYFRSLLSQLSHDQDLNEVSATMRKHSASNTATAWNALAAASLMPGKATKQFKWYN